MCPQQLYKEKQRSRQGELCDSLGTWPALAQEKNPHFCLLFWRPFPCLVGKMPGLFLGEGRPQDSSVFQLKDRQRFLKTNSSSMDSCVFGGKLAGSLSLQESVMCSQSGTCPDHQSSLLPFSLVHCRFFVQEFLHSSDLFFLLGFITVFLCVEYPSAFFPAWLIISRFSL